MIIQRAFRQYIENRNWPWFTIIQKTRPMIGVSYSILATISIQFQFQLFIGTFYIGNEHTHSMIKHRNTDFNCTYIDILSFIPIKKKNTIY